MLDKSGYSASASLIHERSIRTNYMLDLLFRYFYTKNLLMFLSSSEACTNRRALIRDMTTSKSVYIDSSDRPALRRVWEIFSNEVSSEADGPILGSKPHMLIDLRLALSIFATFYYCAALPLSRRKLICSANNVVNYFLSRRENLTDCVNAMASTYTFDKSGLFTCLLILSIDRKCPRFDIELAYPSHMSKAAAKISA